LLTADLLENLTIILADIQNYYLIVGGDINFDPSQPSPISIPFIAFCNELDIEICTNQFDSLHNRVTHSFEQTKMQHYSNLDHFFVSSSHPEIKAVGIQPVVNYQNFSNHLLINLTFNAAFIHSLTTAGQGIGGSESKEDENHGRYR